MNLVQRITKVKFKDGELIAVLRQDDAETEKETTIKTRAEPHVDLNAAFQALEYTVRHILELPDYWRRGSIAINGVSWSYSEGTGVEGACIIASVGLDKERSNAPLNIVTPHLPFEQYSDGAEQPVMPDFGVEALEKLRTEVNAFLDGSKRAQRSFEFGNIGNKREEFVKELKRVA